MKAVIVTEGFQGTGYGHLTRCLSLYQAFEEKGMTPAYVADCDDVGRQLLGDINLVVLEWRRHRDELVRLSMNSDVVVIDSYLADLQIYGQLGKASRQITCLDDDLRIAYPPGVVVNGTIGAERLPYPRDREHRYLLGIDYIPLRKEFWDISPRVSRQKIENVLLIFGGQDPQDMAGKTLTYLLRVFPDYTYHVVRGLHPNRAVGDFDSHKAKIYRNLSASEILQLMMSCDLAISAAGQTLHELARIGLPTIAVGVARNQRQSIQGWIEGGFLRSELWWEDLDFFQSLAREISCCSDLQRETRAFCDGQGARRIIHYLTNDMALSLRRIAEDDEKLLFDWANDLETRKNSFSSSPIPWSVHEQWFKKRINSESIRIYVAQDEQGNDVGTIRFERANDHAVISMSIDKASRGKGLGIAMLEKGCEAIFAEWKEIGFVLGKVKRTNEQSRRSCVKANFEEEDSGGDWLLYRRFRE